MTAWQKAVKYFAVVLAVLLTAGIIGGIVGLIGDVTGLFGKSELLDGMDNTFTFSRDLSELDIEIKAAELNITSGDSFRIETNIKDLTAQDKNGRLVIRENGHKKGYSGDAVINLTLPAGAVFSSAEITSGAGKVTIDALYASEIELELGAGEVTVGYLEADRSVSIDGGAGRFTLKNGVIANLELDHGVGSADITARLSGSNSLDLGVGSVEVNLIGSADDYSIRLDKGLGSAYIDGKSVSDGSRIGTGDVTVEIDSGIGEVRVNFKAE